MPAIDFCQTEVCDLQSFQCYRELMDVLSLDAIKSLESFFFVDQNIAERMEVKLVLQTLEAISANFGLVYWLSILEVLLKDPQH